MPRTIAYCQHAEKIIWIPLAQHITTSRQQHTHTHPFNGPLSGTTQVSRYQKGKTNMDFIRSRDSEWQWHQLGHMEICTSLQTDNHASTPPLRLYRPDALSAAQPTASKHWRFYESLAQVDSKSAGKCLHQDAHVWTYRLSWNYRLVGVWLIDKILKSIAENSSL